MKFVVGEKYKTRESKEVQFLGKRHDHLCFYYLDGETAEFIFTDGNGRNIFEAGIDDIWVDFRD